MFNIRETSCKGWSSSSLVVVVVVVWGHDQLRVLCSLFDGHSVVFLSKQVCFGNFFLKSKLLLLHPSLMKEKEGQYDEKKEKAFVLNFSVNSVKRVRVTACLGINALFCCRYKCSSLTWRWLGNLFLCRLCQSRFKCLFFSLLYLSPSVCHSFTLIVNDIIAVVTQEIAFESKRQEVLSRGWHFPVVVLSLLLLLALR